MHPLIAQRFPRLGTLCQSSKTNAVDNYFAIYDQPTLQKNTEAQFTVWETLLGELDAPSYQTFLRKTAGRVTARPNRDRGWSQLVESFNEIRAYQHAKSLGYTDCRLVDERSYPLPDIEGSGGTGRCLVEAKTIQESDEELKMRGEIQTAQEGLPLRLTRAIRNAYVESIRQIAGHSWSDARKICYLIINLDLRTALADENRKLLEAFVQQLQEAVEIHCISQHWPSRELD